MKLTPVIVAAALGLAITSAGALDRKQAEPGSATGVRSNQNAGQSGAGKIDPSGPTGDQNNAGRAADIQSSATGGPSLSPEQRAKIGSYVTQHGLHRVDSVNFTISVGAAVPRQAELRDLPKDLAAILQGYSGDKYVLVRDQLVIVDAKARRIVAIIPNAG
jgi:hypothetical protein